MLRISRNVSRFPKLGKQRCMNQQAVRQSSEKPEVPSMKTPLSPSEMPVRDPIQSLPKQKKKGFLRFVGFTLLGIGAGCGGVLAYASYDDKFKQQLLEKLTFVSSLLEPYLPSTNRPNVLPGGIIVSDPEKIKEQGLWKRRDTGAKNSVEAPAIAQPQTSEPTELHVDKPEPVSAVPVTLPKEVDAQLTKDRLELQAATETSENEALQEELLASLADAQAWCDKAVKQNVLAGDAATRYTRDLKAAMDDTGTTDRDSGVWKDVNKAYSEWKASEAESNVQEEAARGKLEMLKTVIDGGRLQDSTRQNELLLTVQEQLNELSSSLDSQLSKYTQLATEANVLKHYKELGDKENEKFKKDLDSILPDVTLQADKSGNKLSEDELNSLLAHAHRRVEQLQKQLAEQRAAEQLHLQAALDKQTEEGNAALETKIQMEVERHRREWELEQQKLAYESRKEFERELRRELALQAAAHSEHIHDVLSVQERELKQQHAELLQTAVISERAKFTSEVGTAMAKLQGIEAAVEGRAEAEKRGRKAQELWLSCQALVEALGEGSLGGIRLTGVLKAVREAGDEHPFVNYLINTVPEEAVERGVSSEEQLKARFDKVRRVCKRVGMIDDKQPPSLINYFLSYLQSFLMFNSVIYKNAEDCVDLQELDTYELLSHAKYYLDRGDLESATRFMNQLKGESKRVASDWLREARLFLETRQVALALTTHAAACGLGTLF